jgi:hypothetical protein
MSRLLWTIAVSLGYLVSAVISLAASQGKEPGDTTPQAAARRESTQEAAQPRKVSRTFADLLVRVVQRDKDSGAILRVKPKDDAPPPGKMDLHFSMQERPDYTGGGVERSVVIELSTPTMDRQVYERYILVIDEKMQAELAKLKTMKQQAVEEEKRQAREQAERIKELTNGKLQFGMTEGEVIAALGKPKERYLAQAMGNFGLTYESYSLFFRQNRLAEIWKEK